MKPITIQEIITSVVELVVAIAVSGAAASVVLATTAGVLGYLIAWCAAIGSLVLLDQAARAATQGAKYIGHKVERYVARRRNENLFYVTDL